MKSRKRTITTIIAVIILAFGASGFLTTGNAGLPSSSEPIRRYDQLSLSNNARAFIDSRGNIHYRASEGSIQVYNNVGEFLYRIQFPTGGGDFYFYIDENDILNVLIFRGRSLMSFNDGQLVYRRRFESNESMNDLIHYFRSRRTNEFFDTYGNRYYTGRLGRGARMYDPYDNFITTIRPSAPIWPLNMGIYIIMAIAGVITLLIVHAEFIFTGGRPQQ